MSRQKFYRKLSGSAPDCLDTLTNMALDYNKANPRGFCGCYRCNAFFLDGSRILTMGENVMKTHPFGKIYADNLHLSTHAEVSGLITLIKYNQLDYVTDVVILRGMKSPLASHPCPICYDYLKKYLPVRRLWWNDEHKNWIWCLL